ncbi:MAG TPA: hypothetical protein VK046_11380 [Actinomycetaceae bacterium]|nr:hypothetical protein [Actinomycetaceae bacterium]
MTTTAYADTATRHELDEASSALDEASSAVGHAAPQLDGHEVYCPDAEMWAPTDDVFCQFCGAGDHDLR